MASTLSENDIIIDRAEFEANGVIVLPRFFDEPTAAALEQAWLALKNEVESSSTDLKRSARFVFGELPGLLGTIYRHPSMVALARQCLGPDVALYMNRILVKDEHWSGAVAIHQDMPYFNGGQNKLSIFVPLQPTQAEGGNGGLKFVVGSHKYGNLERGTIDRSQFPPMPEIAPSLDVSDIVVMNFMIWHYSEDAPVPTDRPLMQIVYQPSDDGSFGSRMLGVPQPTLVCGEWKTQYFSERGRGITPDA
jgi:hypothetical protein